ncbi:GntR family transcriptional regulator [Verticiella sediminum]|uniref:GntR family transcriptional regulator n=1 Tax=Verticiella sediminum TaxID=1247510 RepID=A0A556ACR2_9BURK|nr:GntR family transcriptional regulator [Verticiella sediminum]TSH90668.1 GntR family transcriptional regulator [Verticiella sediminum]
MPHALNPAADAGTTPPDLNATALDPGSPVSLYVQIKDLLRGHILEGRYPPHCKLPSENDMIRAFAVSRITVRQALNDLEKEGLIFRMHGKGTFVAKQSTFQDLGRLQGFGEAMRQMGYDTYNKLVSIREVAASPQVREQLRLDKGARVTELQRVRFLNREPISLDVTYVPIAIGERLAREDLATRDVFAILENDYGLALGHADLQISSMLADARLARHLGVADGSPVLFIERLTHTMDGGGETPIDYEHLYYRGDAFRYRVRVERAAF